HIHDSRIAQAKLALDAPYEVRAAARKINIDTAVVNSLQKAVGPKRYFLHFSWTREGGEHHLAMPGDLGGRWRNLSSSRCQWLDCFPSDVVDHQGVAGFLN